MKIQFSFSTETIDEFCKKYKCKPHEISIVLKTSLSGDKGSRFYRDIEGGSEKFDLDAWLISQSPATLLTRRAEALTKVKKVTPTKKESLQSTL